MRAPRQSHQVVRSIQASGVGCQKTRAPPLGGRGSGACVCAVPAMEGQSVGPEVLSDPCDLPPDPWIGAAWAIRTGQLHGLPHFHTRPVNVLVLHGPKGNDPWENWF